jgi:hypothetical protein
LKNNFMPLLEFLIQIKIDFTNTNLLKRRTSPVEQETEAKRQKRSAKTNARKSAKQTRDRFQRKMKEVMKLLSKSKFTRHEERRQYNLSTGYQQDLPDGSQIPFQDNVFWLIALCFANSLVEQMKQQLQRTKDNNEMRKKGGLCKRTA